GAPPTKDISDLKARLGLKRPEAGQGVPGPVPGPAPGRPGAPQVYPQQPARGPAAPGVGLPPAAQQAPAPAGPPAGHDPYAAMRPQQGVFDLRTIDDGA